jgi:hypothetical protein
MKHEIHVFVVALAVLGAPVRAQAACAEEASRDATVDATGATSIRVDAKAGSLRIAGRGGSSKVVVHGTACASDRDLLDGVKLVAERRGSVVHIEAVMPGHEGWGGWRKYAQLNLVIEVPEDAPLDVTDSSGDATIDTVGTLRVEDSSGELFIHHVRGDLKVDDSSGEIEITDVGGTVRVNDSSGEIKIRDAASVVIESDGSGGIDIANVRGSVLVKDDGSGGIEVEGVGGDFTVEEDGSGGVRHDGVKGRVRIAGRR